ncbi:MAG: DUF3108 domain-containing protein [Pseudomonadota bacterium]
MQSKKIKQLAAGTVLVLTLACAMAQEHLVIKRPVDLPPSADLVYKIDARKKGFSLGGDAQVAWRAGNGTYSVSTSARASLLGKILENRSEGAIDAYGLAPTRFHEKRFRKDPSTANFDRAARTLTFNDGKLSYPLLGGEQDRSSVQWQLAATARAAPEKFVAGSEWKFFVGGRRDAEVWTFKVVGRESISTGMGSMQTVHFIKAPQPDTKDQHIDLWLAPGQQWYPVRLRFAEDDGEYVQQTIEQITRK